ncbi:MAG: hypothetical protein E7362_03025 [Clostridiales bacterium]|nr:hypothetical protein [Clostridiales bacterium]
MAEFISNLIGNDLWATIIMSCVPLIELKGGIVFARSTFGFLESFGLAYLGSTVMFIPIFFLLIPILNLFKKIKWFKKLADKAENYVKEKADNAVEKQKLKGKSSKFSDTFIKQIAVFIFVAIPLPMTGVWMGTAIAVFLNLKFKDTILPILLGNLIAGLIISGLVELFLAIWTIKALDYILYGLFALALILLIVTIVKVLKQKPQTENKTENNEKESN